MAKACDTRIKRVALHVIRVAEPRGQISWQPSRPFHPSPGEKYTAAVFHAVQAFELQRAGMCSMAHSALRRALRALRTARRLETAT